MVLTLCIIALVVLLAIGAPIFSILIGFALIGGAATGRGFIDLSAANILSMATGETSAILSTIPLFIFAGYVMAEAKTADRLVHASQAWLGWIPGGLAIVTIFACAIFTTFTGASGVTIVALGGLLMPALVKEKYPERFSLGMVTGTGSVGLLFPPALPLIVYAIVYGAAAQTIAAAKAEKGEAITLIKFELERFMFAGIVPGLVLVGILCSIAIYVAIKRKVPRHKFVVKNLWKPTVTALPEVLIPVLILVGVFKHVPLANLAALTALYVIVLEVFVFRDIKLNAGSNIVRESITLVGAIFIIIFAASVLTNWVIDADIPHKLVDWIGTHISTKWGFLLAMNLALILVGMVMDIFSAIVVVVPLLIPAADKYGIDPYHLGVIFLLNLELGYLTPPVGLNLFISSFRFQKSIVEVIRATLPFLAGTALALVLVTYIPSLTVVPPPKRTGTFGQLNQMVSKQVSKQFSVKVVQLPDGKIKKLADCKELDEDIDQQICNNLFIGVTTCRKTNPPGSECEQKVIKKYVANAGDGDDDDDDDDDDVDPDEFDDGGDIDGDGAAAADTAKDAGAATTNNDGGAADNADDLDDDDDDDDDVGSIDD